MDLRRRIITFSKYTIFGLIIFVVGFVVYNKKFNHNRVEKSEKEVANPVVTRNEMLKDSIVAYGKEFLGTPYVAAGCSKDGFDCSGFVHFVYRHFNIDVPRSTAAFADYGREIPIEDIQKGDLLLFLSPTRNAIGHIGIATTANGRASDFIHASSGKEMKVIITNLSNAGYTRRFVKAVRVL